jgi:Putative transposase/Transposase zinc-binding domain
MSLTVGTQRPAVAVADVMRQYGPAFLARYGGRLSATQSKALRDLSRCRTAALGGHMQRCLDCGHQRIAYNSCRNRHCPQCQALARARWLERESNLLLPVAYYHVVFTLPQEVAELALANPRLLYEALFQAASRTLREVAANPKRLGARIGMLLVLHTWGQNLCHHPHVHGVVTGGGLSCNPRGDIDGSPRWVSCRPGFFLPVRVLSRVFRGKYLQLLRRLHAAGKLRFGERLAPLAEAPAFARWLKPLYRNDWVVYAKRPFGSRPAQVLKYLARYTHRVAISNSRLLRVAKGTVTFRYKDYADAQRHKTMTLPAQEFLRRFLQHVLPRGFVKVRHYGLVANRDRDQRLHLCRTLLLAAGAVGVDGAESAAPASLCLVEPARQRFCPCCGGTRLLYLELPGAGAAPSAASDTS